MKKSIKIIMRITLSVMLLSDVLSAMGQTIIKGKVTDSKGKAIEGVSIGVLESFVGTSTENDGSFTFHFNQKGAFKVYSKMVGLDTQLQPILVLDSTKVIELSFKMKESNVLLNDVVVSTRKVDFLGKKSLLELHPMELRAMGGTNADIANGFRNTPGVQTVNESTGLFVRGGTNDETKVYIDGINANNFFYTGSPEVSQRGRFNPELFTGNYFSTGGFSALYGQALSSILMLETNSIAARSTVSGNVSSVGASIEYNKVLKPEKLSIGTTINYSNLSPYYGIVKQDRNFNQGPEFADLIFNAKYKFKGGNILKILGTLGTNKTGFGDVRFNKNLQFNLASDNAFVSLAYGGAIGKTFINVGVGASFMNNVSNIDSLKSDGLRRTWNGSRKQDGFQLNNRIVLRWMLDNSMDIYLGAEHTYNHQSSQFFLSDILKRNYNFSENYEAIFTETNFSLTQKISARAGLRAETSSLTEEIKVSPRLSIFYAFAPKNKLTLSFGQFYQQANSDYLWINKKLKFQQADHFIVGYQKETPTTIFRAEAYRKNYYNLVQTLKDTTSSGKGYAQGIELFWKDNGRIKNVDYWVSYSYLDTKRQFLNYPQQVQPTFAAAHTFVLVTNYFVSKVPLNIGFTYSYSSGRPYYNPNKPSNDFLSDFTPAYHNTGITVAYLSSFLKAKSVLAFTVSNLLGNEQIFSYRYTDNYTREAISPLARRFFFLGLFLNWGVDKRSKTINDLMN
jgi:vitamin B12 transporter